MTSARAKLARLALTDDRIDGFAGQQCDPRAASARDPGRRRQRVTPRASPLVRRAGAQRPSGEGGRPGRSPDPTSSTSPHPGRRPWPSATPPRRGRSSSRRFWGQVSSPNSVRLDAAALGAKIAAERWSSAEVTQACLDRIAATEASAITPSCMWRPTRPWPRPPASTPRWRPVTICPRRWPGFCLAPRMSSPTSRRRPPDLEGSSEVGVALRRGGDRPHPPGPASRSSARPMWTRFARARRRRTFRLRTDPQPVGHQTRAPAGGGGSAAALAAFQAPWPSSAPTPAGRSASRRATATVGVKPTWNRLALRAGGLRILAGPGWPLRARCSTPRCCTPSSPGMTPATRHRGS